MQPPRIRCVLAVEGGPSRRVGPNGLWIGRQPDCDVVVDDPRASRRHALVRLVDFGAELVPLGKAAISVNGKRCESPRALSNGDQLRLFDLAFTVEIEAARPTSTRANAFVLVRGDARFGVAHTPFVIGGGNDDDLLVKRWPRHALVFHIAQGELYFEVRGGTATHNDEAIDTDVLVPLATGDVIGHRGEEFRVATGGPRVATTAVDADFAPVAAAIEMLPHGGRLVFTLGDGERSVYLADRRFDLFVALLRPPPEYRAGEPIPDDVVRAIVWPRRPSVSRNQINTLISRCRRDLIDAGLAGPRLIERSPGGGATRFVLAPGAEVSVKAT